MEQGWDEHQALASRSRAALLDVLRANGGAMGVDELAESVGLHVNTTREHLDRLVSAGLVSRAPEHRTTRGRPRILYRHREPEGARVRNVIDGVLLAGYGHAMASPSATAELAGRQAAGDLIPEGLLERARTPQEARRILVTELERLGFAPRDEGDGLRLCRCPVESLARERSEVVCAAHLGMTSALVERIGQLEVLDATPFIDGESCIVRLRPTRVIEEGTAQVPGEGTAQVQGA
ncbi:helix-turn-helix domain-containing protein [Isoptericola sp. b441]|uniref:Helix-turn-helix domain-containing protein n=1 Tax=Actinotalea lenta TaxID=3064654 RepID=A0ABT9DCA6_9CELL|nr:MULTISPECIES: helix-turn-helix domain-containing protein [unclassified Isoptericola]MDO8108525.1 helix-turn-helix domain-containing protein [Isoptericola sp. b441]MDO8119935.1 helix-turn-helix domain-containing protein [Isoptericola sp. b490]